MQHILAYFCLFFACSTASIAQLAKPLIHGHAHNDYEKFRPALIAALKNGFVSIEIDVFPVAKELKVAHIGLLSPAAKRLEKMYLLPLADWIKKHKTIFEKSDQQLILMIDIKKKPKKTYQLLRQLCQKYDTLFTKYYPLSNTSKSGPVSIILSGHKPHELVKNDTIRYMLLDGSRNKIGQSPLLYPRISLRYGALIKWRGRGNIPAEEKEKIRFLVQKVHQNGQKVRFWAMPNRPKVWQTLLDLGVDWMNVDNLKKFKKFYATYAKK